MTTRLIQQILVYISAWKVKCKLLCFTNHVYNHNTLHKIITNVALVTGISTHCYTSSICTLNNTSN